MSAVVDFPVKPEARPISTRFGAATRGEPDWLAGTAGRSARPLCRTGFPSRRSEAGAISTCSRSNKRPLLPAARRRRAASAARAPARRHRLARSRRIGSCWSMAASRRSCRDRSAARRGVVRLDGGGDRRAAGSGASRRSRRCPATRPALRRAQRRVFRRRLCARCRARRRARASRSRSSISRRATAAASFHTRSLVDARRRQPRQPRRDLMPATGDYWRNDVRRAAARRRRRADPGRAGRGRRRRRCISASSMRRSTRPRGSPASSLLLGGRTVRHEANVRSEGEGAQLRAQRRASCCPAARRPTSSPRSIMRRRAGETRELFKGVAAGRGARRLSGPHHRSRRARRRPTRTS